MTIAELVAKISLKGGKESVAVMQGLMKSTVATKVALLGAATALYKMSEAARQSAIYMDMYQLNTGLSTDRLQQLSFKAAQAGVSMSELGGTIQKLQQMNAEARLGYGWDPILTRFGLTPGQDPVTQLDKISAALKRLGASNPAEAHALASKVGLSDSMYYALMKMGTEQMQKQLILTDKERLALVKLNQQWNKFWFYLKQIIVKIQALGVVFQTRLVRLLTRAALGFYELFSRVHNFIDANEKLKDVLIALGVVFAAVFRPELLLLAAIGLVLEDIYGYFNGEDSITGRIVEWVNRSQELKDIWEGVKVVFEVISLICLELKDYFDGIRDIVNDISNFLDEHPWLKKIIEGALKLAEFTNPIGATKNMLGFVGSHKDALRPALDSWRNSLNQTNNTNVYIEGTGNIAQDAENAMDARRAVVQANGQQASLSQGAKNGGPRYGKPLSVI